MLLLLERADHMKKPEMVGKIMAACIKGEIMHSEAMRLCNIVDRAYLNDLNLLRTFQSGLQGENAPIAEALHSVGVLSISTIDGGSASGSGGFGYDLNRYGELLLRYAIAVGTQREEA